ncbi:hypothetical protein Ahy_B10g102045 [Arachis hypogaea]|uniref:Uncharacterized protein n=1 Tax=Arachis hypogaea TaxID=3818 RepID=A0A444X143_ARAHY|nr:hypothetical protein Ahy_B10g102045 [Arachis hypogaea]
MYRFIAKPQFFLPPNSIPFQLSHIHKPKKFSGFRLFSMASEPKELPANNPGVWILFYVVFQLQIFRNKDPIYKMDLNG